MWKSCGASLTRCKSKALFLFLPLVFVFDITFYSQTYGGQTSVAYFAGGCFWCTEAVFEQAPGVTSMVSGYMQGAETIQVTFDSSMNSNAQRPRNRRHRRRNHSQNRLRLRLPKPDRF